MAKTKISEYDSTSANNTDVDSINIAEGCAPSGINNAIREVMAHLKDFQTGASGDSLTVGGNLSVTGTVTIPDNAISGDKVEGGTINAITINTLSANPTLTSGTANGVTYLNGSKVLTSGSALTFDGNNLKVGYALTGILDYGVSSGVLSTSSYLTAHQTSKGIFQFQSDVTRIRSYGATAGSGQIAFNVGGGGNSADSEAMRLTTTGLGIGTSSPVSTLEVTTSDQALGSTLSLTNGFNGADWNTGDVIGTINFRSNDTSTSEPIRGSIKSIVENTSGATSPAYTALTFSTASVNTLTERLRLDSAGNLGLGVTPSGWTSTFKVLQLGGTYPTIASANAYQQIGANFYNAGAGYLYTSTGYASRYLQSDGAHSWHTAPSGTAGAAISFTQAMTLTASSELNIDSGTGGGRLTFTPSSANNTILSTTTGFGAYNILRYRGTQHQWLDSAGSQAMTLDAGGNFYVGCTVDITSSTSTEGLYYEKGNQLAIARSGGTPLYLNRMTSDGDIAIFRKDGTTVGSIGTSNGRLQITAQDEMQLGVFGTPRVRIFSSLMRPETDNQYDLGISTSRFKNLYLSGGVYVGGTGAANHLDDYEQGTFTPIIEGETTTGTGTYTGQVGRYTKIGNRVFFTVVITWTAHTGTGGMRIISLPFTSNAEANNFHALSVYATNLTFANQLSAYIPSNASYAGLIETVSGSPAVALAMDTSGGVRVSGHYETNA